MARLVKAAKERNPQLTYVCDPVMGDLGGLYIPVETATAIRDHLIPIADIATPNRYELQWMVGGELLSNQQIIDAARSGKPHPNFVRGGLKDGFVKTSAYGPAVTDAAKKQADGIKAQMVAGSFDIFKGPLKDNKGGTIIPAGKAFKQTDLELEKMNYLVEGVNGSV